MNLHRPAPTHPRRISLLAGLLVVLAAIAALGYQSLAASSARVASPSSRGGQPLYARHGVACSARRGRQYGQAAVILTGQQRIHAGPNQHPAPIASVAKVMTAYLVLRDHPLRPGEDGPTITLTAADVADTDRRAGQHESVVPVAAGEQLTELQALQALLLPSANNIAAVLARLGRRLDRPVRRPDECRRAASRHDPHPLHRPERLRRRNRIDRRRSGAHRRPGHAPAGVREHRRHAKRDAASRRHRPQHQHPARHTTGSSASRPVRTTPPAAASPSAPSAGSPASGRAITGVVLGQPGDDQVAAGLAAADAIVRHIAGQRSGGQSLASEPLPPQSPPTGETP